MVLDHLPSSESAARTAGPFKVIFSAGKAAAETQPKQPNAYGAIEWTELVEMWVHDRNETLVATIVLRELPANPWRLVTGCRFEHSMNVHRTTWKRHSDTPGTGPNFHAELKTFIARDRSWGDVEPPPMWSTEPQHEVAKSRTASAIKKNHDFRTGAREATVGVRLVTAFGPKGEGRAQRRRTMHARSASFSSYFMQRVSSFMRERGRSVESRDITFPASPPTYEPFC